ncbi:MAG: transglycosylase SLT domain-containing protein [Porticoccaceae bacterium]
MSVDHPSRSRRRTASILFTCIFLLVWSALAASQESDSALRAALPAIGPELEQQRDHYRQAAQALARGDRRAFAAHMHKLSGYPLAPYLEYADMSARIDSVDATQIAAFLERHPHAQFSRTLRQRWLDHLAAQRRWPEYVRFYDADLVSTQLACRYGYALFQTGDSERGAAVGIPLWQVGSSQPEVCDPLFEELISAGHISEEVAWVRYTRAVFNHQYGLANYVSRFLTSPSYRQRAELYLRVDRNPHEIANYSLFTSHTPEELTLLRHGLTHLARSNPRMALNHWNRYHQSHTFDTAAEQEISSALVRALYQAGDRDTADQYLQQIAPQASQELLEWRLRLLVEAGDWQSILHWSAHLSATAAFDSRWKYWRARALELTGGSAAEIRTLYQNIAGERSFYGFLASEWLGTPHQMQHEPVPVDASQLRNLANREAFIRIRELLHQDDRDWARREWHRALSGAPQQELLTAAKLAELWGWDNQAIAAMIQASYWNDIQVRFPLSHRDSFQAQARNTGVPVNLLFAIARQESAFNPDAVSSAGARGLLQLMPATATETAKRHGIAYRQRAELHDPIKNIALGSRYYMDMLKRFGNNRILATAAYNAGPGRVASWRARSAGELPFDVWIELIPFRETRNYVQNVLAFSIIYAHRLGLETTMLTPEEKGARL